MTGCLQNCRFYRTIISNFSSKVKLKFIENYRYLLTTFMLLTYVEKTSYLRLRRLVIPLLTKTVIIYEKIINICYNLLWCLKLRCLRNVQIFIDLFWGVLILQRQSTNFLITPRKPTTTLYYIWFQSWKLGMPTTT